MRAAKTPQKYPGHQKRMKKGLEEQRDQLSDEEYLQRKRCVDLYGEMTDLKDLINKAWKQAGLALSNVNLEHKGYNSRRILSVVVYHKV